MYPLSLLEKFAEEQELKRAEEESLERLCTKLWLSRPFFIHDKQVILDLDTDKGFLHRYDIETYNVLKYIIENKKLPKSLKTFMLNKIVVWIIVLIN